ncbi:hypothetical protein EP10_000921 [Geobacillus icigianus]|uniref:Uncharacterized protein n=1 Tax=Geobacillus icigianus TaxID=1430331 RepID=A0ABU6BDR7_9BACL|nr:hypothetical protein [Geobacillus icigianus]TWG31602.1 hypothetical protein GC56T2_2820 [Geobacillus sp. C56-T2]
MHDFITSPISFGLQSLDKFFKIIIKFVISYVTKTSMKRTAVKRSSSGLGGQQRVDGRCESTEASL